MTKSTGDRLEVHLLRPATWVRERGAKVGGTVELHLEELGAAGPATVLELGSCPPIPEGDGNVVTGLFRHESSTPLLDVGIAGEAEPIGVTANHPFWVPGREEFVQAGELSVGDEVDTLAGIARITTITARGPPEAVFNLEVFGEHVYRVGVAGTLVHNEYDDVLDAIPRVSNNANQAARDITRYGQDAVTVRTFREADDVLARAFPNATKQRGPGRLGHLTDAQKLPQVRGRSKTRAMGSFARTISMDAVVC